MFNLFNSPFQIVVFLQALISLGSVDIPGHIVLTFQEASFMTGSFLKFSAGDSYSRFSTFGLALVTQPKQPNVTGWILKNYIGEHKTKKKTYLYFFRMYCKQLS